MGKEGAKSHVLSLTGIGRKKGFCKGEGKGRLLMHTKPRQEQRKMHPDHQDWECNMSAM